MKNMAVISYLLVSFLESNGIYLEPQPERQKGEAAASERNIRQG